MAVKLRLVENLSDDDKFLKMITDKLKNRVEVTSEELRCLIKIKMKNENQK